MQKKHKTYDVGFEEARRLTMAHTPVMGVETQPLVHAVGRICAADCHAVVDSPSVDVSTKDGYAVLSADIAAASPGTPVPLAVVDQIAAGQRSAVIVSSGQAARILTGAPIPAGADAVLAEEFATRDRDGILAAANARPGRNIMPRGTDVARGNRLAANGTPITPPIAGLLAAGGLEEIPVYRRPVVGLLATGSEVLLPGHPLEPGKLYASNIVMTAAWLRLRGITTLVRHAVDAVESIHNALNGLISQCDAVVTSGGAWKGDRDLTIAVLEKLGWQQVFHRARMGPGKAVAMGTVAGKPVFCLPGGPTSNEMAFLMIALPAILKMAGYKTFPFLQLTGKLETDIRGQKNWTQFVECLLIRDDDGIRLRPMKMKSRLASMARTEAIVQIPEGCEMMAAGEDVPFICMNAQLFGAPLP